MNVEEADRILTDVVLDSALPERAGAALDVILSALREATDDATRFKADHEGACKLVAEMHTAAVGETRGPDVGVVEDIATLRRQRDLWMEDARRYCANADHHREKREAAEAACAEMRCAVTECVEHFLREHPGHECAGEQCTGCLRRKIERALSSDAGRALLAERDGLKAERDAAVAVCDKVYEHRHDAVALVLHRLDDPALLEQLAAIEHGSAPPHTTNSPRRSVGATASKPARDWLSCAPH